MSLVIKNIGSDVSDRHTDVSDRDTQHPEGVQSYTRSGSTTASLKMYGHRFQNGLVLAIGDVFALGLAIVLASGLRYWILGETFDFKWGAFVAAAWLLGATLVNLLPGWGLGAVEELKRIVTLLATVFGLLAVILFFSKVAEDVSRLTFSLTFAFATFLVPLMRVRLKRSLIALNAWGVPSVIYGAGEAGRHVAKILTQEQGLGYIPIGIFDDDPDLKDELIRGIPVLGTTEHVSAPGSGCHPRNAESHAPEANGNCRWPAVTLLQGADNSELAGSPVALGTRTRPWRCTRPGDYQ